MATHVRYPNTYVWLVFLSALDAMLTYVVLNIGGHEANPVAITILKYWGFRGMVLYKFALITFTIVLCETVGRRDDGWGRRLGTISLALSCLPVVIAIALLARWWGSVS